MAPLQSKPALSRQYLVGDQLHKSHVDQMDEVAIAAQMPAKLF